MEKDYSEQQQPREYQSDISNLRHLTARYKKFPLQALLQLHIRCANRESYINYYEGFRALASTLGPISADSVIAIRCPDSFNTYEFNQITAILGISHDKIYGAFIEVIYGRDIAVRIAEYGSTRK